MKKAAGILALALDTKRLLLMQRSPRQDNPLTWATFGGGHEDGESARETALREFAEETGYQGKIDTYFMASLSNEDNTFTFFNYFGIVPTEFDPHDCWETFDYGWFSLGDWPSPLHPGVTWLFNQPVWKKIENILVRKAQNETN